VTLDKKTVPDAALQTPRRCVYFRLAGLTYNFLQTEGVTPLQQGRRIAQPLSRQRHPTAALTEGDIDELVAFLASLTSPDYKEHGVKELARQRELSLTNRPQRDTARAFGPKPL